MAEHTFIDSQELFRYVIAYGWILPASIIVIFLTLYGVALRRRINEAIKKRKDLTDITHRSNGHHKKQKVH